MLRGKNVIRDGLCLIVLIFMVRYAFTQQYLKNASRTVLAKHAVEIQILKVKTEDSKTATKVKKQVKEDFAPTLNAQKVQLEKQTNTLLKQLKNAQETVDKTDLLSDQERTTLTLNIKTIRSHIDHIKKEYSKEPQEWGLLSGSALTTAREAHRKNLDKKLLQATNNVGSVLLILHNEVLGDEKKINPATSVSQGLQRNQTLLI